MKPVIGKLYTTQQMIDNDWVSMVMHTHDLSYYVPIQVVVREPKYMVPDVGRGWCTNFLLYKKNNKVYLEKDLGPHINRIQSLKGEKGYSRDKYCEHLYIIEQWDDYGEDGNLEMHLIGYIFTTRKVYEHNDHKCSMYYNIDKYRKINDNCGGNYD